MRTKNLIIVIIALIAVVLMIGYFVVWPWVLIFSGTYLPNPLKPEITYGEFPFKLVYEINGKKKVIEDSLICEYDGIGINEGQGKYRKWKDHLASGKKELLLLKVNNPVGFGSGGKIVTREIYYNTGSAGYYMGDLGEGEEYDNNILVACYFEKYADGSTSDGAISQGELLNKYHIKLISWDYTKPIKNKFSIAKK